jgi:hypothetical protein
MSSAVGDVDVWFRPRQEGNVAAMNREAPEALHPRYDVRAA